MKRTIILALLLLGPCIWCAENRPVYRCAVGRPLRYTCTADGTVVYGYAGSRPEAMKVSLRTDMLLTTEKEENGIYQIRCTPRKTVVRLNNAVLEDISASETMVSALIPETRIEMRDNGEIVSSAALTSGIIDISGLLKILPAFPSNALNTGARWMQRLDALSFPGLPMAPLEFWYQYEGTTGDVARFRLIANQIIRDKRQEKDVVVSFRGKNTSTARVHFNRATGAIEKAEGNFDIDLKAVFSAPDPGIKKSEPQSLPLTVVINVRFAILQ